MMKNFAQFMKQAQQMQQKIADAQTAVEKIIVEGESGAGLVKVSVNGRAQMKSLKINPSLLKDEVEIVEDLILAAYNDARVKAETKAEEEMKKASSGMNLPAGMNLPF